MVDGVLVGVDADVAGKDWIQDEEDRADVALEPRTGTVTNAMLSCLFSCVSLFLLFPVVVWLCDMDQEVE